MVRSIESNTSTWMARRPSSFSVMNYLTFWAEARLVELQFALTTRLTVDSWSAVSRIWKLCGSPALPVRAQQAVAQAVEGADPHTARVHRQ